MGQTQGPRLLPSGRWGRFKAGAYRTLRYVDAHLEKGIILVAYTACAGIIAFEVGRRFLLDEQVSWSTTVPAYMFVWLTWPGAALAVRMRSHLAFNGVRQNLSRWGQYASMQIDYVLYLTFAFVAVYYSFELVQMHQNNFSSVPGTVDLPSWWFYLATPVGWSLLVLRVFQNAWEDFRAVRSGSDLRMAAGFGSLDG